MIGQTIAHYEILEQLGGGAMGIVYKARDQKLDRLVALKFLPPELSKDEGANARFMQEARAASALDHPSICTIHDIRETEDGRLFIVMAYYEGQTLKYRLNDGSFEPDEAAEIVRQIAEGLAAAHEAGIVHRDIKPANIMVTEKGRVKILDFGIAKLTGGLDLTKTGGTVGTAYYMSPEQIKGEQVDHRTDLWSLGVVLYQMLTGNRPFEGEYEQAVSYAVLNKEPPELSPELPEPLREVTARLLEKEPSARYQGASEVSTALGHPAAEAAIGRGIGSASRRFWLAVAVLLVFIASGLLVVTNTRLLPSGRSEVGETMPAVSENTIAVMPFSVGGEELAYLDESMVDLLSLGIQGAGDLHTVDPNTVLGHLGEDRTVVRNPERANEVAAELGAGRFVMGSVTQLGPQIRINASLFDSEGLLLQQAEARAASEEHLAAMVDTLVVQLIAGQVAQPLKEFVPLVAKTTSSFPALKAYLRGEYAYRQGRFEEGNEALHEAFELDSTFALALDRVRDWRGTSGELWERLKRHRDKLPERERLLLEAEIKPGDSFKERTSYYLEVTNRYPTSSHAWFRLGDRVYHLAYQNGMLTSEARPYLERALRLDPNNGEVLYHLIELAAQARDFDTVDSLLERYPNPISEQADIFVSSTLSAVRQGNETRLDTLMRVLEHKPLHWTLYVAIGAIKYIEDIPFALRVLDLLRERPAPSRHLAIGFEGLAEAARGRFRRSDSLMISYADSSKLNISFEMFPRLCIECPVRREFLLNIRSRIAEIDTTRRPNRRHGEEIPEINAYLGALVAFQLDDWPAFLEALEDLKPIAERKREGSLAYTLQGSLEALVHWRNGDLTEAIHAIHRADSGHAYPHSIHSPLYNHTLHRYLRGEFLFAEERYEEALPWFTSLVESGDHIYRSIPYQGPSLVRRAEIYKQLGDKEKAADFYRRFIKLWENADAEVQPFVEEARESLDRLIESGLREPPPG